MGILDDLTLFHLAEPVKRPDLGVGGAKHRCFPSASSGQAFARDDFVSPFDRLRVTQSGL